MEIEEGSTRKRRKSEDSSIHENESLPECDLSQDIRNNNKQSIELIKGHQATLNMSALTKEFRFGASHFPLNFNHMGGPHNGFNSGVRWPHPSPAPLPNPFLMTGYPNITRGHELMHRLCTSNPQFASSVLEDYIRPQIRDGDVVLEIECGNNVAMLYLSKLCQGSKGPCIWFQSSWLTPNEFQYISGRETAKDWKRSIRHCGKSMKLLLTKGILTTHPPICDCEGCRISSPVNRGRLIEVRRPEEEEMPIRTRSPLIEGDNDMVLSSPGKFGSLRSTSISPNRDDRVRIPRSFSPRFNVDWNGHKNENPWNERFIPKSDSVPSSPPSVREIPRLDHLQLRQFSVNQDSKELVRFPQVMLPFFASVVRPPFNQGPAHLLHQTQTLLRLVSHHQRQHLLLQQQNQFEIQKSELNANNVNDSDTDAKDDHDSASETDAHSPNEDESGNDLESENGEKKVCKEHEVRSCSGWSVDDVCKFVSNVDLCEPYVETFRKHAIDGSTLELIGEDRLMNSLNMKLGPILKLKTALAKYLGGPCPACSRCNQQNETSSDTE